MNISITKHKNGSYFYKLSTGRKVRNSKNVLVHERLTRRGFSTKKECHEHAECENIDGGYICTCPSVCDVNGDNCQGLFS